MERCSCSSCSAAATATAADVATSGDLVFRVVASLYALLMFLHLPPFAHLTRIRKLIHINFQKERRVERGKSEVVHSWLRSGRPKVLTQRPRQGGVPDVAPSTIKLVPSTVV
ncbi:hypothetical protein BHE74_00028790 [Ensete ventricosum]|nr:hypothetical protein BHE74_00028790 [Ensete ventricosum]